MRAMGAAWILRGPGSSITPRRRASRRTGGTEIADRTSAAAMTKNAGSARAITASGDLFRGQELAVERVHLVHEPRRRVALEHVAAARERAAARGLRIRQGLPDRRGERARVACGHQPAALVVAQEVGSA